MSDRRLFRGANGEEFWSFSNDPVCAECERLRLPCVSRIGSSGSCYQCTQRRAGCNLSRSRFVPRSLRGTGFIDDSSSPSTPVVPRHQRRTLATSPARGRSSPSRIGATNISSHTPPDRSFSGSRSARSISECASEFENLALPDTRDPVFLDLTAPGPARSMSIPESFEVISRVASRAPSVAHSSSSTLSLLSRTPSRSPSIARSTNSRLSLLSWSPSAPICEAPPTPRTMKSRRLSRLQDSANSGVPARERSLENDLFGAYF